MHPKIRAAIREGDKADPEVRMTINFGIFHVAAGKYDFTDTWASYSSMHGWHDSVVSVDQEDKQAHG